jgi:hypothetical protein
MNIHVFLLCYNESVLIPHTVNHYKKNMPSCIITILDNKSTDNSVELAKSLGCNVITWSSNNIQNEYILLNIRNNCWKNVKRGWIIMADMDEFICITESELLYEKNKGTTIINIKGIDMIGESKTLDLTDIDLQQIKKYRNFPPESKKICFLRQAIKEMNYSYGSHNCNPVGKIRYSSKPYFNKHMCNLGLPFLTEKMVNRYERNNVMRQKGMNYHYTNDVNNITTQYNNLLNNCKTLNNP